MPRLKGNQIVYPTLNRLTIIDGCMFVFWFRLPRTICNRTKPYLPHCSLVTLKYLRRCVKHSLFELRTLKNSLNFKHLLTQKCYSFFELKEQPVTLSSKLRDLWLLSRFILRDCVHDHFSTFRFAAFRVVVRHFETLSPVKAFISRSKWDGRRSPSDIFPNNFFDRVCSDSAYNGAGASSISRFRWMRSVAILYGTRQVVATACRSNL